VKGAADAPPAEEFAGHAAEWWAASPAAIAGLDRSRDNETTWHVCYTVVRSTERRFGVLLVVSNRPFSDEIDVVRTMGFLGYLAGAMLERQEAESLHGRLLIAEEQARIAAEIHDGVSQSLFSLVYGLQGSIQALAAGKADETQRTLATLRDVAAKVSREIRTSIYHLAQGADRGTFVRAIRACLDDIEGLYGIRTELEVTGSEENLSPALKRAVYRIVREASSNAARHGQGSVLRVRLGLTPKQTIIEVADNGVGFVPPPPDAQPPRQAGVRSGLGLLNMRQLAKSFNGAVKIDSTPGRGAVVTVRIPDLVDEFENGG
jgi:NarL family two-component system sensor histidine kinase LiaS